MSLQPLLADDAPLLSALKERVRAEQFAALKAVNTEKVERHAENFGGKGMVQQLAADLQQPFFEAYQGQEKVAPIVRETGGTKNVWIFQITSTLPQNLAGQLPPPEAIAALLEGVEQ